MFCENCGAELQQKDDKFVCPNCGAEVDLTAPEQTLSISQFNTETASEYITPRGFSSKKNIIIIILAAILVLGLGVGITAIAITNSPSFKVSQGIDLAERYLSEQNYEQAIIEYEKVLEIEPMNVDAYLGLANAYERSGDIDKAIEILREGLEMTGDERIKEKLDELTDPLKMPNGFEWVLEPTYEYDDVVMLKDIFDCFEKYVTLYYDYNFLTYSNSMDVGGLYVVKKGDKKGLNDAYGNVITDPLFNSIYGDKSFLQLNGLYTLDTQYNLTSYPTAHGWGTIVILFNYYDNHIYNFYSGVGFGPNNYELSDADTAIVFGANFIPDDNKELCYEDIEDSLNGCGLYSNGKLVVPIEYDAPSINDFDNRFVGNSTKDKCVMMKNNKIYIYDLNGNCLSDGIYEKEDNFGQDEVYFDGYLTVCRDGKWGLLDENCNEVVKCQFDDISAVYEGNAWVKLNGKWGVIKIKGYSSSSPSDTPASSSKPVGSPTLTSSSSESVEDLPPYGSMGSVTIQGEEYDIATTTKLVLVENSVVNYDDVVEIGKLVNLTYLDIQYTHLSDISPLANLTNLTRLNLQYNSISDISPLANLTHLTHLNLWNNRISDISPLANLTNLTDLRLHGNDISDISPLANLTKLETLLLTGNQIYDISSLANLTKLETLYLSENQINDISSLSKLYNLDYLNLTSNSVSDVSPLANLTNLTHLNLMSNSVSDVSPLANLINLTHLYLNSNKVSIISAFANLDNLEDLDLSNNQIKNIAPLENLTKIIELNLGGNKISNISPLANLNTITKLILGNNEISNITPLANLTNLTELYLWNNQLEEEDKNWLKQKLPNCEIDF